LHLLVDQDYPKADKIVLMTDNLNTHTPACLYERLTLAEAQRITSRLEWHYTPEHGSWLNIAEGELSVLARQCLNRRIADKESLVRETTAWQDQHHQAIRTIVWQFTTADARIKLKRLYPVVKERNSS